MTGIQKKMFAEIRDKTIFGNAIQYGSGYIDKAADRNVYPTTEALDNVKNFDESF
ncbi:MAG TPA: hypothetical protein VK645_00135 [Chitinophagaceae bacterium]|nr:hypothetical protein [Chitinophagaceae bacterium]